MEQQSRTRLVTFGVLATVFVSGLVLGAALQGSFAAPVEAAAEEPEAETEAVAEAVAEADAEAGAERARRTPMWEEIGPTDEQRVLIEEAVGAYRAQRETLREESRAQYDTQVRELILQVREDILEVFDQEQADAYRALLEESDRRRAERESSDRN